MTRQTPPKETWNIAEVEIVENARSLSWRFARLAALWAMAFLAVVLVSLVGLGVAEAAPIGRLASVPSPAVSVVLAGAIGGSGGLLALLLRRLSGVRGR